MSRYMDEGYTTLYRAVIVTKGGSGAEGTRIYGPYLTPGSAKAALNRNHWNKVGEMAFLEGRRDVVTAVELRVEKCNAPWVPVVSFWKTEEGE